METDPDDVIIDFDILQNPAREAELRELLKPLPHPVSAPTLRPGIDCCRDCDQFPEPGSDYCLYHLIHRPD